MADHIRPFPHVGLYFPIEPCGGGGGPLGVGLPMFRGRQLPKITLVFNSIFLIFKLFSIFENFRFGVRAGDFIFISDYLIGDEIVGPRVFW